MLGEIRQYQINRGMVESYLEVWNKQIFPNHKLYGIKPESMRQPGAA